MLASNTFCHVDQTFDRGGNVRSEADNRTFDQIWFAQVLLDLSNNNAGTYDGEMGPKTRAAIRAFQKQIGVPQTGEVDDALIAQLRDGMGGAGALLDLMRNDPSYVGKVPDYTFSYSASPVPTTTLGEEIMLRSEADRRMALATMLNTANVPCSRPARSVAVYAETKFADWHIDCADGAHRLSVTGPGAWKVYDDGGGAADASPRNLPGANPVRRHRDDSLPATPGASGQNQ
jgi:hypothetical protein